jgi:nucleoside phosphorylase
VESGRLGTARVAVLTIIDEEFEAASLSLGLSHHLPDTAYYCAERQGSDVVLRQSPDRSQVPAMSVAQQILEDYRPEVVLLVGIAGGIAGRENN